MIAPDRESLRQRLQTIVDLDPSGQRTRRRSLRAFLAGETDAAPDLGRVAIIGTPDEVRQRIEEYIDAGDRAFHALVPRCPERCRDDTLRRARLAVVRGIACVTLRHGNAARHSWQGEGFS